ncbi:MAG: hypothetical protein KDC87_07495 [Planctomycetes bacterium]|nr:hypothetical protein [Planctomycetota bacterium]MCB9872430.1 hypothetical protein [Planctomycetota bacterium]MCB9888688.1 hypothetical protein [Planctomycetota bacterium]
MPSRTAAFACSLTLLAACVAPSPLDGLTIASPGVPRTTVSIQLLDRDRFSLVDPVVTRRGVRATFDRTTLEALLARLNLRREVVHLEFCKAEITDAGRSAVAGYFRRLGFAHVEVHGLDNNADSGGRAGDGAFFDDGNGSGRR